MTADCVSEDKMLRYALFWHVRACAAKHMYVSMLTKFGYRSRTLLGRLKDAPSKRLMCDLPSKFSRGSIYP
jgi:hypothetical protein